MLDAITLFLFNIVVYNIPLLYGTAGEIMIEKSGASIWVLKEQWHRCGCGICSRVQD